MDRNLRIAALARLAASATEDGRRLLVKELEQIERSLHDETDFETLEDSLKTLRVIARQFPARAMDALVDFVRSVPGRSLSHGDQPFSDYLKKYRDAAALTRESIDAASALRYLETERVLALLLELARVSDDNVRNKALQAMNDLAEFNLDVFYGAEDRGGGLGADPQLRIVRYFNSLKDEELVANCFAILRTISEVLSPSMQGTSWSYNTVTFSRGATPPLDDVALMRHEAIELTKRIYPLVLTVKDRKSVLRTMHAATRRENVGDKDAQANAMFVRDALAVLGFFKELVPSADLPLVQVIEHDTYWVYYHAATVEVERAALDVRETIAKHVEYGMYKTLIGFEGIFGDWEKLKTSESAWNFSDDQRNADAERFVEGITEANFDEWRRRILRFSETESDDLATFPVYYHFLKTLALCRPALAFHLLTQETKALDRFLIALLNGLWKGELAVQTEAVVVRWLAEGRFLTQIAKSLYGTGATRLQFLSEVISKAAVANNTWALVLAMGVAATLHGEGAKQAIDVFMKALRELVKRENADWAKDIWHNRDFKQLVRELPSSERAEVLQGLRFLDKIDYQAEEILFGIAQYDPGVVLEYLLDRLRHERADRQRRNEGDEEDVVERYEAIPYQLHKLNEPLSKMPEEVIGALRKDFESEDAAMFTFRGARLLKAIFPTFTDILEQQLIRVVGRGDSKDIGFVLAILRNYEGATAIQSVCKAIVKVVPERSEAWNEVAAAIESTGVVSGEYGIARAYERKREEIAPWKNDEDGRVRAFAEWLTESLDHMITGEVKRTEEELTLRKYRYGAGKEK